MLDNYNVYGENAVIVDSHQIVVGRVPTILVVEDSEEDRVLIEEKVRQLWPECNIRKVESLEAAYEVFRAYNFDMVILDLNLPDTNGAETVQQMRAFNRTTPIIVLTGALDSQSADQSLRYGANNIYPKSRISDEDFLNILEQNSK